MFMNEIFIKEKIIARKYIGVTIGLLGALSLILFSNEVSNNAPNITLGNILFVVNCLSLFENRRRKILSQLTEIEHAASPNSRP